MNIGKLVGDIDAARTAAASEGLRSRRRCRRAASRVTSAAVAVREARS
jgi:hypothetical protein